jgi:hypothetical protein
MSKNIQINIQLKSVFAATAAIFTILTSVSFIAFQFGLRSGSSDVNAVPNGVDSTALPIAKGGTNAITESAARTNLDVFSKDETNALINNKVINLGTKSVSDFTWAGLNGIISDGKTYISQVAGGGIGFDSPNTYTYQIVITRYNDVISATATNINTGTVQTNYWQSGSTQG